MSLPPVLPPLQPWVMRFISIDPGKSGAIGVIDESAQLVMCEDLPIITLHKVDWVDSPPFTELLLKASDGRPARIMVERAQSMPGQGVASTFTTGVVMGSILAACQRIAVPLEVVSAATWKRSMGLDSNKQTSLDRARLLWPSADLGRKRDHNRAESLLLAEYARRKFIGLKAGTLCEVTIGKVAQ